MSLYSLPNELVLNFYLYLDHGSQVSFSLSCKRFAPLLADVVKEHKRYRERFHRASSHQNNAVAKLLYFAFDDPSVIWHLRTFDVFGSGVAGAPENEAFESFLAKEELSHSLVRVARDEAIHQFLHWTRRTPYADLWDNLARQERYHNQPELCQMLLLALCPRLRALTLHGFPGAFRLQHSYAHTYRWQNGCRPSKLNASYLSCKSGVRFVQNIPVNERLSLICETIRTFRGLEKCCWPSGFRNLRRIYVGDTDTAYVHPFGVAALLSLPSLESLHVTDFRVSDDEFDKEPSQFASHLPRGSSAVQHLSFTHVSSDSVKHIIDMALGAAKLRNLVVQEPRYMLEILGPVAESHGSTLERALFHGSKSYTSFPQPSPKLPRALRRLAYLTNVHVITLNLSDLVSACKPPESFDSFHIPDDSPPTNDKTYANILYHILQSIPRSLHTLIFQPGSGRLLSNQDLRILDDAFSRIVTGRLCPNLWHIYFDGTSRVYGDQQTLPRTIALASLIGIDVQDFWAPNEADGYYKPLDDELFKV